MRIRALSLILPFIAATALAIPAGAQPANDRNNEHRAPPAAAAHPAPHAEAPAAQAPPPQPHFAGPPPHDGARERRVEERHFEERHFEERRFDGPPHFGGGYDRHFPDREDWHRGAWRHEWHDGRYGWWWAVGPEWYFFPAPVYPYPEYAVVAPPPVAIQPAPPVTGAPPSQFWYYCNNPPGYYPQVPSCSGPWQEVPAAPQQ